MKANRINLVTPVRVALIELGISTVQVVDAVNADLGNLTGEVTNEKTGAGRTVEKGTHYAVSTSQSVKHTGKLTMPLLFDAWHSKIEAANKVASFERVEIPRIFGDWLAKMKLPVAAVSATVEATVNAVADAMAVNVNAEPVIPVTAVPKIVPARGKGKPVSA